VKKNSFNSIANQIAVYYQCCEEDCRSARQYFDACPTGVSEEVFKNMIEERRRIANERRAEGEAEKEKIRAEADRDRVILLSEAARKAEELRGRGDAEAAATYSAAFSQHPNFYDFYRSMAAYRRTLGTSGDFFLLSPESDFFRFLKEEDGNVEDSLQ
jgi:membrane protease subunit HflC